MKNRRLLTIRLYYGILALLLIYTLIAQCALTHSQGRSLLNTFSYFTIQSNVLVIITSLILALKPTVSGTWWRLLRLAAIVGITVTGIVFITILAKYVRLSGAALFYNYVFHYISPIASVIGFIVIGPRVNLKWKDMAFMAWPTAWLVYTMVRGEFFHPQFSGFGEGVSHYPYGFLDVSQTSLGYVIGSITIIALLVAGLGALYIRLDRHLLGRPNTKSL